MNRLILKVILLFIISVTTICGSEMGLWPSKSSGKSETVLIREDSFPFLSLIFAFYHFYISPNDFSHCPFNPSCSLFMYESVKQFGLTGVLMGFDRLTRDNPWIEEGFYPKVKGHYIDPPRWHYLPFYKELNIEKVDILIPYIPYK